MVCFSASHVVSSSSRWCHVHKQVLTPVQTVQWHPRFAIVDTVGLDGRHVLVKVPFDTLRYLQSGQSTAFCHGRKEDVNVMTTKTVKAMISSCMVHLSPCLHLLTPRAVHYQKILNHGRSDMSNMTRLVAMGIQKMRIAQLNHGCTPIWLARVYTMMDTPPSLQGSLGKRK